MLKFIENITNSLFQFEFIPLKIRKSVVNDKNEYFDSSLL